MRTLLIEIGQLFRREKIYSLLLIFIILFYVFSLFAHKVVKKEISEALPQETIQNLEDQWRNLSEDPEGVQKQLKEHPPLFWAVQFISFFFIGAFTSGIWFGALDLRRLFLRQELIPSSGQILLVSWGMTEVVKLILLFLSAGIVMNLGLVLMKLLFGIKFNTSLLILVQTLALDIAVVFFIAGLIRRNGSRLNDLLGFRFSKIPFREIWIGIRTYFVILPVFVGVLLLLVFIASLFSYEPPPHPLVKLLLKEETVSPWMMTYSLLAACVIGPIVEEIFFRGFLYPALRKYWGMAWTMLVTSGLFAWIHENAFSFVPIFFLGLTLSYLYEKRNNLLPCISLHVLHNTAFIGYFFLMKSIVSTMGGG
ncbi:MAG: hypothetical protein A3C35_01355 [Omnitrophica bacterium RIFCSPHIGHO2_02_FULL_46_11]|nr:MAG: hypothetical protein A3C35_01355 [Omnitrophica bacterium RIFCSPHIGHO2_02_FULL_46_11]OGW86172.1 MAG: hypothetical protein A3A81_05320 [Omnitrophica bacterium RIFCSPLOWO2_01_FULL_45_10b]